MSTPAGLAFRAYLHEKIDMSSNLLTYLKKCIFILFSMLVKMSVAIEFIIWDKYELLILFS